VAADALCVVAPVFAIVFAVVFAVVFAALALACFVPDGDCEASSPSFLHAPNTLTNKNIVNITAVNFK
jgi:hypothetical protein